MYMANLKQPGSSLMNDAYSWLPAILRDDAASSVIRVTDAATDALGGIAASSPWVVDIKDLLLYGDQFVNFTLASTDANMLALPNANLGHRFAVQSEVDGLFMTAADAPGGIRMDGIVRLSILGTQTDTSVQGSAMGF
jgi:hypothetical protein